MSRQPREETREDLIRELVTLFRDFQAKEEKRNGDANNK